MVDCTHAVAATKIKAANKCGLEAYRLLHKWYTGTGDVDIQSRRAKLIYPQPVPDNQIIEAMENHEAEYRELQELAGETEVLQEAHRVLALR